MPGYEAPLKIVSHVGWVERDCETQRPSTSNVRYYNSQLIGMASDTVLTRRCFVATMTQYTYINSDKVVFT